MTQLLIKDGTIITMDKSIVDLKKGDVLINGERIVKVAPKIRAPNIKIIDATDMIICMLTNN